jgi:hypothetical protein
MTAVKGPVPSLLFRLPLDPQDITFTDRYAPTMVPSPMGARSKGTPPRKRGPKPETLVLPGPWEGKVGKALKKPPPPRGWPKPERKPKKKGRGK